MKVDLDALSFAAHNTLRLPKDLAATKGGISFSIQIADRWPRKADRRAL